MKDETVITLGRMLAGTTILATHMATGTNSTFVLLGVFLLGIPIELVQRAKKEET